MSPSASATRTVEVQVVADMTDLLAQLGILATAFEGIAHEISAAHKDLTALAAKYTPEEEAVS